MCITIINKWTKADENTVLWPLPSELSLITILTRKPSQSTVKNNKQINNLNGYKTKLNKLAFFYLRYLSF